MFRNSAPAPGAVNSHSLGRWSDAVDRGARGWYASASASARTLAHDGDAVVRSLACSLEGSLLRQLGMHDAAAVWDGRALAESDLGRRVPTGIGVDAAVDALVGLAADSIGPRRLARARSLLTRAEGVLTDHGTEPGVDHVRVTLRSMWVRCEVAMAAGDAPLALDAATRATELAASMDSERHRIKTAVILSAAKLVSGDSAGASADAVTARERADAHGFLPLAWAAASISEAVGDSVSAAEKRRYEVAIRSRGGRLS